MEEERVVTWRGFPVVLLDGKDIFRLTYPVGEPMPLVEGQGVDVFLSVQREGEVMEVIFLGDVVKAAPAE